MPLEISYIPLFGVNNRIIALIGGMFYNTNSMYSYPYLGATPFLCSSAPYVSMFFFSLYTVQSQIYRNH